MECTDSYDIDLVLIPELVTTGEGGEIIVDSARHVLATPVPESAMGFHVPDGPAKRMGQSVPAAGPLELEKE